MAQAKSEYPPLFDQGFHPVDFDQLESKVLSGFDQSTTRSDLWAGLKWLADELSKRSMPCKIWVDGSFVTEKIDPADVDIVLEFQFDELNAMTAVQKQFVQDLNAQKFHAAPNHLHTFVIYNAPIVHVRGADAAKLRDTWEKMFGYSRDNKTPKGIPVLEIK